MSLIDWMAAQPVALTLTWGHVLMLVAVFAFVLGWEGHRALLRFRVLSAQFEQAFVEAFAASYTAARARREARAATSQFEKVTPPAPYAPPVAPVRDFASATSKTPSGGRSIG